MYGMITLVPICVGGFSINCGFNIVRSGLVRVSRKGIPSCSWEFYGEFDVWIYGIEMPLKLVDMIFPGGTVDIISIP